MSRRATRLPEGQGFAGAAPVGWSRRRRRTSGRRLGERDARELGCDPDRRTRGHAGLDRSARELTPGEPARLLALFPLGPRHAEKYRNSGASGKARSPRRAAQEAAYIPNRAESAAIATRKPGLIAS